MFMAGQRLLRVVGLLASLAFVCCVSQAIESPQYKVVHSGSDVEIRLYQESWWMSAPVGAGTSFNKSTEDGFHRLYQYIHGANQNLSRIAITAPILTSISRTVTGSDTYSVGFYMPPKDQQKVITPIPLPQPYPQLNLQLDKWGSHCIAVRRFPGFARDENVHKEAEDLFFSLDKLRLGGAGGGKTVFVEDKSSFAIAQYNASFHLSGRVNEVWVNVSGFTADGCP